MLEVPSFGNAEDNADQFSAFMMLLLGKEDAWRLIGGAAYSYRSVMERPNVILPVKAFSDVHGHPAQRFYNFLCIGYGGEPEAFKDLADKWLGKARASTCAQEYKQVRNAFNKTVMPHVDPVLLKKVQSIQWIRPDDGRWD